MRIAHLSILITLMCILLPTGCGGGTPALVWEQWPLERKQAWQTYNLSAPAGSHATVVYAATPAVDNSWDLTVVHLTFQGGAPPLEPPQPLDTGDEELDRSWEELWWRGTAAYPATTYIGVLIAPPCTTSGLCLAMASTSTLTYLVADRDGSQWRYSLYWGGASSPRPTSYHTDFQQWVARCLPPDLQAEVAAPGTVCPPL